MLDLSLISPDSATHLTAPSETDILAHSRRPAILTYMSPLANIVNTIAEVPLLLLGFRKEAEKLDVRMMEAVEFAKGWRNVPNSLRLEMQADEKMQVYSASVRFVARFAGLRCAFPSSVEMCHGLIAYLLPEHRWVMYNHRIISFLTGTTLFWLIELSFTALAWITLSYYLTPNNAPTKSSPTIKPEPDETDSPLSSTPRTFPTFSRQSPLQYPTPRTTPGPDPSTGDDGESSEELVFEREPALAGEADDEEEEEEEEYGETEMFSVGGTAGLETRPTDSGIGTSMEEGRGRGLQRRRSRPA
jgi:seipin